MIMNTMNISLRFQFIACEDFVSLLLEFIISALGLPTNIDFENKYLSVLFSHTYQMEGCSCSCLLCCSDSSFFLNSWSVYVWYLCSIDIQISDWVICDPSVTIRKRGRAWKRLDISAWGFSLKMRVRMVKGREWGVVQGLDLVVLGRAELWLIWLSVSLAGD